MSGGADAHTQLVLPVHQPALSLPTSYMHDACVQCMRSACFGAMSSYQASIGLSSQTTPASGLRAQGLARLGNLLLLFASVLFVSQATTNPNNTHTHTP